MSEIGKKSSKLNDNEKNIKVSDDSLEGTRTSKIEKNKENQFVNMIKILFCKKPNKIEGYTDKTFAILTSLILRIFGYSLLIIDVLLFIGTIYYIFSYDWGNILEGVLNIVYIIAIMVFNFLISVLLVGTAKEQEDKGYNTTIPIFSAIVSFIALIISLIALIK